ncbi:MAG: RES family NAD+ phosphorylase [Streptosporangiaceae bacterium]|jgi:hypothetical protein
MPAGNPPPGVRPQPRYTELPAGSFLWRVTRKPADGGSVSPFLTVPDADSYDARLGGRFDPTPDCPYPYCYAAFDDLTALCEVLLRNVGFDGPQRYLLKRDIAGRRLAILETTRPLWLVSLQDAADLAAACQDSWLIHTETPNYRITRRWAHWLRDSEAPDGKGPAGLVWLSKRAPNGRVVLLFGDRCDDAVVFSTFGERRLDDGGLDWLNLRLAQLRTKVRR